MLSNTEIRRLIETEKLIDGYKDLDTQLQVNGFDLTILSIDRIVGAGLVGFSEKRLPDYSELEHDTQILYPNYYLITLNEVINLPLNLGAQVLSRSSLLRCGAYVEGAWFDRGYKGRPQVGLRVCSPIELKPNARICQIAFFPVEGWNQEGYNGSYQGR